MTEIRNDQPHLQPLFFSNKGLASVSVLDGDSLGLPSEILHGCLIQYANWGDLAKLACVQKGWSRIMFEAAENSMEYKWNLARALLDGSCGLIQNHKVAMKLLLELANVKTVNNNMPSDEYDESSKSACFSPAMLELSKCYFNGVGAPQDSTLGMAWLQASYSFGNDMHAAHDVAHIYEYGKHGIEIDVVAAAEWLNKAAEGGNVESMSELALCYELGCGVEQSDELSLDWYTKAANEGHVCAKFSIGEAYEEARGVPQSDEEACLWYYRAATLGDEDSKVALRRLGDIARIVIPGVGALLNEDLRGESA